MLQATKNKYGIETLKTLNVLYDHEHWLTQEDVDMANRYVELIEQTRSEITPQTGDRLIYLSRHGDYYGNALIDSMDEKKGLLSICEQPYVPFVWQSADNIRLSVSGGAFHHVKTDDLKFNGWTEGAFKDWGHCGSCAHGSVTFTAKVHNGFTVSRNRSMVISRQRHTAVFIFTKTWKRETSTKVLISLFTMKRTSGNSCKTMRERYSRGIGKTRSWYGASAGNMSSCLCRNGKRLMSRQWSEGLISIPSR